MPNRGIRAVDVRPTIDGDLMARVANIGVREGWYVLPPDRGESRVFYRLSTVDPRDSPGAGTAVHRLYLVAKVKSGFGTIYDVEFVAGELTGDGPEAWEFDDTVGLHHYEDREEALAQMAKLAAVHGR